MRNGVNWAEPYTYKAKKNEKSTDLKVLAFYALVSI